jgi:hypothetical protein
MIGTLSRFQTQHNRFIKGTESCQPQQQSVRSKDSGRQGSTNIRTNCAELPDRRSSRRDAYKNVRLQNGMQASVYIFVEFIHVL